MDAFAVPRQLFADQGRCAAAKDESSSAAFFTADDYAAYSIRGDVHESRLYGPLEMRRQTIVTPVHAPASASRRVVPLEGEHHHRTKNMVQLLVDAIAIHEIQGPENMVELDNARRRVSGFSVAQHARYLVLQHKLFQALQRGLPEVLALSSDESKEWHTMKAQVAQEQVAFCRIMARGLAAEVAKRAMHVPARAKAWGSQSKAMHAQCWHDIYRLYPRWFEPCMAVKFGTGRARDCDAAAAGVKAHEVAARGTCCAIVVPTLPGDRLFQRPTDDDDDDEAEAMEVVAPRQAISVDVQAAHLMETYDCDVAISSSTLVTLFDSDTSTHFGHVPEAWTIPMTSRHARRAHGHDGTKKRLFMDRPLAGNEMGTRATIAEAGRAALLARFETESVREGSTGGSTAYHVWQLETQRILVRRTTHVKALRPENQALEGVNTEPPEAPLSVFVKPDYHVLGLDEQLTTSERCRFWLHSWLRGGSLVLVARVNPQNDTITSWKTYSLASLIYGDGTRQLEPLEAFNPTLKFQWLSTLFTTVSDLPVGNYLLRPLEGSGTSTFGHLHDGVEVLMASAASGPVDLYTSMPQATTVAASRPARAVLPAWNLSDRIPYTFQTGRGCLAFFIHGHCAAGSAAQSCDAAHLRLVEQQPAMDEIAGKAKRWRFAHYRIIGRTTAACRPASVTVDFAFCGDAKAPPRVSSLADVDAPVYCTKRSSECLRPHLTLHQILDRLADQLLRKGRGKRRAQKHEYRQQHKSARQEP